MGGSDAKMAELILYVSDRCQLDPAYGSTKLNKILFYADFLYYAKHGTSITGQEYMRLDKGPYVTKWSRKASWYSAIKRTGRGGRSGR